MDFDAPVTVMNPGRRGREFPATGKLVEISASGAFFALRQETARARKLAVGDRVVLFVHCEHPTNGQVRIRFPADVVRVRNPERDAPGCLRVDWEVAVRFRGRHRFFLNPRSTPAKDPAGAVAPAVDGLPVQ